MEQILNYSIVQVGRSKDYTNKIINDFLVLYRTEVPENKPKDHAYWLVQCQKCKKYKVVSAQLLRKQTISCDCVNNLTGQIFGRWTVLYKTGKRTSNRSIIWHCRCECGNEKDVDAYTLRSGQSKSCGCLQKEMMSNRSPLNKLDLTGQRFGKLVALYPIKPKDYQHHTKWHCKCDCGNECDIDIGNLRQGFSQSCGCVLSKQEENIIKLLTKENILFKYQYKFQDLNNKIFDFYVNEKYIIEYDGAQHFYYSGYGWNTKEQFETTHKNDIMKNEYCFKNNIPIIRIPYDAEYSLNDLKLETTRFLLTPENQEIYYKNRIKIEGD